MNEHETFKVSDEHERERMLALNYLFVELTEETHSNQESQDCIFAFSWKADNQFYHELF